MIASPAPDGQERHAPMPLSTCRTISGIHRAPRRQANSRPSATQSSRPLRVLREATRNESANACSSDSADSAPRSPCGRVRELLGPTFPLLFGQAFRAHFGGLLFLRQKSAPPRPVPGRKNSPATPSRSDTAPHSQLIGHHETEVSWSHRQGKAAAQPRGRRQFHTERSKE